MRRKFFVFLLILLFSVPFLFARKSIKDNGSMIIKTSLDVGTVEGVFFGFSSSSYDDGLNTINDSSLDMNLVSNQEISEVYSEAEFYVYWVIGSGSISSAKLSWEWSTDYPKDFRFIVSDSSDFKTEKTSGWDVLSGTTDASGSQYVKVKTSDLRDTAYTTNYVITFTLEATTNS